MKLILLAWGVALCVALPSISYSQEKSSAAASATVKLKTITGSVLDEKGVGLENAVVEAKGASVRAMTGSSGVFKIEVPERVTELVVSYVGMASKEVKLEGTKVLTVSMTISDNSNKNDVIVIGYGSRMTAKENPFAAAKVKMSDIENIPAPNIAGALRNRVVGLSVNSASGRPGSSISLNIRNSAVSAEAANYGLSTDPLYVIDDIIVGKSVFDALDPTMVEELTILKDAGAAMYGAAGAKGVILVRTKRGKPGKTRFSYNGFAGTNTATRFPEMLSAYDHAVLVNQTNRLKYKENKDDDFYLGDSALNYLKTLPNRGWIEDLWQTSLDQRHSLSMSGGSENVTFQLGAGYRNQNGNYAGIKNDRFNIRGNLNMKLANNFKADVNFNIDQGVNQSNNPINENDQAYLEKVITIPRWVPRQINGLWVNPIINSTGGTDNFNPWAEIGSGFYQTQKSKSWGVNAAITYAPEAGVLKGLSVRFTVSQNGSNSNSQTYKAPYKLYNFERTNTILYTGKLKDSTLVSAGANSQLNRSIGDGGGYRIFATIQYAREFGLHKFSVMGTGEQSESSSSSMSLNWRDQQIPDYDDPFAYNQTINSYDATKAASAKRSYLSRFSYGYAGKYSLDGIVRFDASSNFARGNVWGVSPTVGVSWVVSDENFFRDNIKFINYFKIRTSVGITGDDRVNSRLWQDRYKISKESAVFGDTMTVGLKQQNFPNPDITWERKRTINVGFEVGLLKNRLNLGVEFFQNYSYDAFDKNANDAYPAYSGFIAPVINYWKRYGWGSEFSISYNQPFRNDWNLKVSTNFGFSNTVLAQATYAPAKLWVQQTDDWLDKIGTDPRVYNGSNYGLICLGMFRTQTQVDAFLQKNPGYTIEGAIPQPGWLYYKDTNGDGVITGYDKTLMYDRTDPWLSTGTQIAVQHKSFALSVNIAASFGGKMTYDSKIRRAVPTFFENVAKIWTDRWTPETPDGKFPRTDDPSLDLESTFWSFDATTIRINDASLSYRLPPQLCKRLGFSNISMTLAGNNLLVLKNPTPYKDPYSGSIYDYPTLRTVTAGLQFGF
jgi:TonB-linked SusC/RagA family outer membrane protein